MSAVTASQITSPPVTFIGLLTLSIAELRSFYLRQNLQWNVFLSLWITLHFVIIINYVISYRLM